jgi:SynChlorMet cassette radical SAM/SPASM protein ScmE
MTLEITNECNLRCKYCSHFSSAGDVPADLPLQEWLQFIAEMGRLSVMRVTLSGGEPFFRQDLPDLIQAIARNRMRFSILSNGTLIDDERAALIVSTGRCDYVQVSIDGSIPITHDSFRGQGSFRKAINGLRTLQRHGVPATVRVTIHRKNVRELEDIARLLLEEIGLPSFSTNSACFMGLCRKNTEMVQLTTEERSLAMQTLLDLHAKYNGRIGAAAGPLAEGQWWLEMVKARREGIPPQRPGGRLLGCGGPLKELTVRADGVIVPCGQLPHIELGHINQDDLRQIWLEHPELIALRQRRLISLTEFAYCDGCEYIDYCTGNCPALAYTLLGRTDHPSPDSCLKRFLEEGGRLPERVPTPALPSQETPQPGA